MSKIKVGDLIYLEKERYPISYGYYKVVRIDDTNSILKSDGRWTCYKNCRKVENTLEKVLYK